MKTLVVYDSVFGNTEKVARALGDALGAPVVKVGEVQPDQLAGLDALVVGSPTRAFSPTPDAKEFLKGLAPNSLPGVKVAAFDTRISVEDANSAIYSFFVKFFGYAAAPIAKQLVKKGGDLSVPPEGFLVEGSEGPLKEGELERAKAWVRQMQ